ncbi:DNA/RNA non-specific endonuclease, partial [Histophilus somni]|uniref:DNA/RNA non-specific endonuclease n=1 Tax=Histophilus somni TaxID=731 RepID=UPI000A988EB5
ITEQAGLIAGKGGYHIEANNVHLKGSAIASTTPNNSELQTNRLTFNDIRNESSHKATSVSISGTYGKGADYYQDSETGKLSKKGAENAVLVEGKTAPNITPSLPMHSQGSDSSVTKATLTEGKITLNKDTNPIQTTAKALGINTDLSQANSQVAKPKEVKKLLVEQKEIARAVGYMVSAIDIFTSNLAEEAKREENKAKAVFEKAKKEGKAEEIERVGKIYREAVEQSENWDTGGKYKQAADFITAIVTLAVAGKPTEAIVSGGLSPYINQAIKEATKDIPELNIPTHILWGAIESHLKGGNAVSGAIAVGVGEVTAHYLATALYHKDPRELSENEKQEIIKISEITSAIASGLSNGVSGETLSSALSNLSVDSEVTQSAVENNFAKAFVAGTKVIIKAAKKRVKNGRLSVDDLKATLKEEGLDIADNLLTLADGELTWDDALATIDLVVGTEFNTANRGDAAKKIGEFLDKKVIKKVDGYDVREIDVGRVGQWNKHLNKPEPNTIYKLSNGHEYKTDALGRVEEVKGRLKLEVNDRNRYQQAITGGECRLESDCGGHLLASMFGGAGEKINLVAMDEILNGPKGKWYQMERQWKQALEQGKKVEIDIKPIYRGNSKRPDSFEIKFSIDNSINRRNLKNTATGE